jgi:Tfp pilus assembly protein PilO
VSGPEAIMAAAVFGGGIWLLSPIARAAAERLRPRHAAALDAGHQEELAVQVERLQQDMIELQERLDFAERMLAKQRDLDRLAPPR